MPARRQCRDPARRLGKPAFLGGDPRLPSRRAQGGRVAGGCDPGIADHRPAGGGRDAAPGRLRRRHRAARRARADRAGAARKPHSRARPSRRALPHLYRCRRRSRHGAGNRAQRQDAAHRRLRRDGDVADRSAHRRGAAARRSPAISWPRIASSAATKRRAAIDPAHRRRERRPIGIRNISTPSCPSPSSTGWKARSRISRAMARTIPKRS